MKIIFLGTGSAVPTKTRNCQSVAVESGGAYYIFDCGAPLAEVLASADIPLWKVKAVFLSHIHRDHISGLWTFACLRAFSPDKRPLSLFTPSDGFADALITLVKETAPDKVYDPSVIKVFRESEGEIYDDGQVKVSAIPTRHQQAVGRETYAYEICDGDKRVFITGDLLPDASDFPSRALTEKSDAVVTELHHFYPSVLFPLIKNCPTSKTFIIHIDECNRLEYEQKTKDFSPCAFTPKDGEVYEI